MSEEERARKFVERHFPVTAAFLAAERGEGLAPVYGPGEVQNAHDDQPEPHIVVRVAYRLSRWELFAALADGYATTNTGQNPDDMTVAQIRDDVEAYLSLSSWRDMEGHVEAMAAKVERGEYPEHMQALKRAMDRAYPVQWPPVRVQRPVYGDGTVTLDTLDHGRITIPEPSWCDGHDGEDVVHRQDIGHAGGRVAAEFAGMEILPACISWGPFAELRPEPYPVADIDELPAMEPDEVRALAAELALHLGRLYRLSNHLEQLRRAES
jgi:hypothetical protein